MSYLSLRKDYWYQYNKERYKCLTNVEVQTPMFIFYYIIKVSNHSKVLSMPMSTKDVIALSPEEYPELYL